jgi:putative oxidoreductase
MNISGPIVSGQTGQSLVGVARIVMGIAFVWYGLSKLYFIKGTIAFVSAKLPMGEFVFWLAVVLEAGGGLLLIAGYATRWVSAFYAFYVAFVGFVFHLVLNPSPLVAFQSRVQVDHFFENLALAGGFLILMVMGPGAWALDNSRSKTP